MKKCKFLITILCMIIIFNVSSIISLAGVVQSPAGCNYIVNDDCLPQYNSYAYYMTSLTPYAANNAIANAIATWNEVVPSMQLSLLSGTKDFDTEDGYNTIGTLLSADVYASLTGSYTTVASNFLDVANTRIYYSDIILNDSYAYGNGQNNSYYDYQGIFTHELGHVWGLFDIYDNSTQFSVSNVNGLPTMFGDVNYDGWTTSNITIFLRDLTDGDENGLNVIKGLCGF